MAIVRFCPLPGFLLLISTVFGQAPSFTTAALPKVTVTQSASGFDAAVGDETVHVQVCSAGVVHVVTRPRGGHAEHPQPWLLPMAESCPGVPFQFTQDAKGVNLRTEGLTVHFALNYGTLSFNGPDGKGLLTESTSVPRTYTPVTLNGEATYHVIERFAPDPSEGFYGLGQHQGGLFNYRGATVELGQNNTDIAVPLLVSTKGYGILWNTAAFTYFDNRFPLEATFDSMAGDGVDFFVLYGPEMDQIIHQYRTLTGHAPMLPKWAYGFIQSKDRYNSMDEMLTIANRYRSEHIPVDAIVQDWHWWVHEGDPIFNERYHDVPADLKKLHDLNIHTMISTWGLLDPESATYKKMDAAHHLIANAKVYDASSPEARDMFWQSLNSKLFAQGWDSFWLDSAEPEESSPHIGDAILRDKQMAIGNGALYTNVFPLLHNTGIQEHWRKSTDQKRVFLLTRSAFLGQQRIGGTVWSGDVYSSWWALARQVPAGLNYAVSGLPYWTTDIGGYHAGYAGQFGDPAYEELYLRWFEFGVFCPVFRTHGHRPANEFWAYPNIEPSLIAYDKLRYRLMPYIYSLGWKVTNDDSTIERPLVMDFRADPKTWNIGDAFMFGPALLVNPVTEEKAIQRRVYLPKDSAPWYDFWTNQKVVAGTSFEATAPLDRIPLYVRAGSILPMGPDEEFASQKPNGPIELRVYAGADGSFRLYQDEGDNYNYEKGAHATTLITWSERDHTLTLGARMGSYPGIPDTTTFHIVWARPGHGVAGATETAFDKTIEYTGALVRIRPK